MTTFDTGNPNTYTSLNAWTAVQPVIGAVYVINESSNRIYIARSNNGSPMNDLLLNPRISNIINGWNCEVANVDATASLTITSEDCTISGAAFITVAPTQTLRITCDGTNYLSAISNSVISSGVVGIPPSTDKAIVRFSGTSADFIQNSVGILSDAGALSGLTQLNVGNIQLLGSIISTQNLNGNLILSPNGTGIVASANSISSNTSFILGNSGFTIGLLPPVLSASYSLTFPTTAGTLGEVLTTDGTGVLSWSSAAGNVVGPSFATDTAIVLYNGTTGKLIKNSVALLTPVGGLSGLTQLNCGNIQLTGNIISATNSNGNVVLTPNGTGIVTSGSSIFSSTSFMMGSGANSISLQAPGSIGSSYTLTFPANAGASGQVLTTNGVGLLSWTTVASGNVVGPVSSTNTALAVFSGTSGTLLANSVALLSSGGALTGLTQLNLGNLQFAGNTISTTNPNGNLVLAPNGSGIISSSNSFMSSTSFIYGAGGNSITMEAPGSIVSSYTLVLPINAGISGQVLSTNGAGILSWTSSSTGNVTGPVSSTTNAIATYSTTLGTTIQNSVGILTPGGALSGLTQLNVANIQLLGDTVSTTDINGSLVLTPNGTGVVTTGSSFYTQTSFIMEDPGAGTNTITLQAPTLSGNYTLTFPVNTGTSGQVLITNGAGVLSWSSAASGDVSGPVSSTNNALATWNGTTGLLIQNSVAILTGGGALSGLTQLNINNLQLTGNTISTTNTNGNLVLAPNGIGQVTTTNSIFSGTSFILGVGANNITLTGPGSISSSYTLTLPINTGTSGQVLTTNGSGVLSWTTGATGNVSGPGSSTSTAIALWNNTSGTLLQNSVALLSAGGALSGLTDLMVGNIDITANTISSTNTNGNIILAPNGTGIITTNSSIKAITSFIVGAGSQLVTLQGSGSTGSSYTLTLPTTAGGANTVLTSNGSGVLSWTASAASLAVNPVSGTAYTYQLTDNGTLVQRTTSSALIADILPQAGITLLNGWYVWIQNNNTTYGGRVTPTTSTINGLSYFGLAPNSLTLIVSDGTNYSAFSYPSGRSNNFITGSLSGRSNTTASYATIYGYEAGFDLTTGSQNSIFGATAGNNITTGSRNTLMGYAAGGAIVSASDNVAIGGNAGAVNTAAQNVFIGSQCGVTNNSGTQCVFIGYQAGNLSIGGSNTFVGWDSGLNNAAGASNTFVGASSGTTNTSGTNCTFLGASTNNSVGTESYSIALGYDTIATASNQLAIGSAVGGQGVTTQSTVGATGGASALPANPLGYLRVLINGTDVAIPYYNH